RVECAYGILPANRVRKVYRPCIAERWHEAERAAREYRRRAGALVEQGLNRVRRLEQWSAVTCRPSRCSHGDVYLVDPLQPRGTGASEHVDNPRGRTHPAEREQSGALEFAMTQELTA